MSSVTMQMLQQILKAQVRKLFQLPCANDREGNIAVKLHLQHLLPHCPKFNCLCNKYYFGLVRIALQSNPFILLMQDSKYFLIIGALNGKKEVSMFCSPLPRVNEG